MRQEEPRSCAVLESKGKKCIKGNAVMHCVQYCYVTN